MSGSILSPYIWVSSWGPTYNNSCRICVALAA
jgi:hypothetical protein